MNKELREEIIERWVAGGATEYSLDGGKHWWTKEQLEYIQRYAAEREKQARIDELHVIAPLLGLKGDVNADHTLTKGDCWDVLVTRKRELSALKETTE